MQYGKYCTQTRISSYETRKQIFLDGKLYLRERAVHEVSFYCGGSKTAKERENS